MVKRLFDIFLALTGLLFAGWLIALFYLFVVLTMNGNGIFRQQRVGRYGQFFTIYKLRSMEDNEGVKQVTPLGRFMRRFKIDELPQLINILAGDMSFVGPRPDVPGYYDNLTGNNKKLLQLRPGLTGPASIKYANEEQLLAAVEDPVFYNDEIIFPDKVRLNMVYLQKQSLWLDIKIIACTLFRHMPSEFK